MEKNEQNVKSKMKKATRISKEEISQTPQEDEKFYEDLLRDIQLVEYTLKIEREKKAECELVNDQFMNSHIKIYPGNSLEKHAVSYNNSRAQYEQQLHHHLNENNESTKLKCKSSQLYTHTGAPEHRQKHIYTALSKNTIFFNSYFFIFACIVSGINMYHHRMYKHEGQL